MRRAPVGPMLAAILVAAAPAVPACSRPAGPAALPALPTLPTPTAPGAPGSAGAPAQLPPPEALTDVMYRLADPAVPGTAKLGLVADAGGPEAAALDRFAAALRDGGYAPVEFRATDVHWAGDRAGDAPGTVLATVLSTVLSTVTVTTTNPAGPGEFSFPLEFRPAAGGWQLTRESAEMLLALGDGA